MQAYCIRNLYGASDAEQEMESKVGFGSAVVTMSVAYASSGDEQRHCLRWLLETFKP